MQKRMLLTCAVLTLFPIITAAHIRPVATISGGIDSANVYTSKTITILAPFQNAYVSSNHHDAENVAGLFLGAEGEMFVNYTWQIGVSYFQSNAFMNSGNVYQFANPNFNNLRYEYLIQSKRISAETKLSQMLNEIWHPFITLGAGQAYNKAYAYKEFPVDSTSVPMAQIFNSHSKQSFTYSLGLGLDYDVYKNIRLGMAYKFLDLGSASLGTTPSQASNTTISKTHLYTNEILLALTYLG